MLGNSSFSQKGATPGQKPLNPNATTPGQLAYKPPVTNALAPGQFGGAIKPMVGNNPGQQLAINSPHGEPAKPTIQKDVAGNSYSAPKPNPNVLAQQQALNKKGAGLVEDGIAGPKTREAIAKYNTPENSSLTPEQLKTNTDKNNEANYGPKVGSSMENAQNVLNAGNQTELEKERLAKLDQAGQMTPEERAANEEVARANELQKGYQNVAALSPYAEASMFTDRARTPGETQNLQQAPDLAGRAAATYGLTNSLGNIYGSSRVAGANAALQGIQTAAGRGLTAASTGLGAAQTQASRAQSGAGTVLGAGLPGQISGSARTYNPLDPAGTSGVPGIIEGAKNQTAYDLAQKYQQGLTALRAADNVQTQIIDTLKTNPTLNQTPISAITNLNELFSGQTSQPGQQLLAQQIKSYVDALGIDSATIANQIAAQQQGTLAQLLDSLRKTAELKNEANNPSNLETPPSTGGTTGNTTKAGGYNFKLVDGKWVPA